MELKTLHVELLKSRQVFSTVNVFKRWQAVMKNEREYTQTDLRTTGKVVKSSHQLILFIQIVSPKRLRRLNKFYYCYNLERVTK